MNPLTHEWVAKAEGDFATAGRELRARKEPNYDAACFHAEQCAEKYLKAILQEANISFGRIHNLIALLELLLRVDTSWESMRSHLQRLTGFAVSVRYPGESADRGTAREALILCRAIRSHARARLGLEP
jgi:HEPN domain-containing protein